MTVLSRMALPVNHQARKRCEAARSLPACPPNGRVPFRVRPGGLPRSPYGCVPQGCMTRARRSRLLGLTGLLLAATLILAAPAFAARGHEFAGAFGWGVVDGKPELQRCESKELPAVPPVCQSGIAGAGPGQFNDPAGIAVNEATGDVYVVDKGNNRVEFFNAAGSELLGEFDGSGSNVLVEGGPAGGGGLPEEVPTGRFDEPEGIAVDNDPSSPSFGDVYVADAHSGAIVNGTNTSNPVVDKFSASGKYIGQITRNPDGEEFAEAGFRRLYGVAVDPRGAVWVEESNFGNEPTHQGGATGAASYSNAVANVWRAFQSTQSAASAVAAPGFAVDGEDNLYVHNTFPSRDRLAKFSSEGVLLSPEVDEEAPTGVAVELSTGEVYVSHASNVARLDASAVSIEHPGGVPLETLKAPGSPSFAGVAVSSASLNVYVADPAANRVDVFAPEAPGPPTVQSGSEGVAKVTATSADFSAEVNPRSEPNEEATSYSFRYGPCASVASCPSSPYPQGVPSPEGVLAANYEPDAIAEHVQGLLPHTVYHVRVFAHNSHPSAEHPQVVGGEELIFTTQGPPAAALPDSRRYEMVSPPDKHGAIILPIQGSGVIQSSAGGDALTYLANAPSEAEPPGFSEAVQILSRRGAGSWESADIATPHEAPAGLNVTSKAEYRFFSEDLSRAVVQPFGPFTQATSPQASEQTLYLRSDFPPGDPSAPCGSSCYRPLVTGCPGEGEPCPRPVEEAANVPEGTKFGEGQGAPFFLGASADASHVVFLAGAKLTEDAPAEVPGGESLYEWAAGKLAPVSVLPGGEAAPPRTQPTLGYAVENGLIKITRHAVSDNGSRVVFSEQTGSHHLYVRRMSGEPQTIKLDTPEAACTSKGKCKGAGNPIFQTASADGSRIFFTDSQPLTQSSGNSDLYECRIEEAEEEPPACRLSDLTPPGAGEEGGGVLGLVAGAAENGSAIYFTANAKLSSEANARGEEPVAGDCKGETASGTSESETAPERCNLYVRAAGQTRLVAVLSGADFPDWSLRGNLGLRGLSDRVSPDGQRLAFMSRLPLSGYDNRDAVSGKPDQEVFLYDSAANAGQGGLVCASCDPTGGRPHGVIYKQISSDETGIAGGAAIWPQNAWIAASVPGWTAASEFAGFALHQPRYLSDSGRLFFNAADALVPQDTNSTEDVYQYEPPTSPSGSGEGPGGGTRGPIERKSGVHTAAAETPSGPPVTDTCTTASPTYSPASGGCVNLISSGTAKEESAFLDASESGDDVFLLTGERLLPNQDLDANRDIYDAHACTGTSPCLPEPATPPPACEGDACQSPGAPPEDQTPGSLTFQGPGNPTPPAPTTVKPKPKPTPAQVRAAKLKKALKACHRLRNRHKRQACEKTAHKRYGAKASAKRSAAVKARKR